MLPAHPRVCGENYRGLMQRLERSGSSPRVRGKPLRCHVRRVDHRLIPACAGKTVATFPIASRNGAHPRVCGENTQQLRLAHPQQGSSPRVRGKPMSATTTSRLTGLIPACAGKTNP